MSGSNWLGCIFSKNYQTLTLMNYLNPASYFLIIISLITMMIACQQKSATSISEDNTYYQEQHRPQFHFSPDSMWMNDPNGMVYHEGEYHLFYQFYPDSNVWGPMHWGHAVSKDMVHWEHLPIALYPDSLGLIFSGSAVVDHNNTSGLGENGNVPMIAIFTHHNMEGERAGRKDYQYQSIAFSNDNGRTWEKYHGNPVVANPGIKDFRDPKVIWHKESKQWIMVFAAYDKVMIYNSPNLIDWTFASEFGIPNDDRLWECPDLFPLTVEGTNETKWVLITSIQRKAPNGGTATSYFVGDFDGKVFTGDHTEQYWADFGKDNYAMVTWSDIPESDGRRLALGWMSNWQYATIVPTERWRSAMTIARELTLHTTPDGYKMRSHPVEELSSIEGESIALEKGIYKEQTTISNDPEHNLYKLDLSFEKPANGSLAVRFSNTKGEFVEVGYLTENKQYYINRSASGIDSFSEHFAGIHLGEASYDHETIDMLIYLDLASVELFADEGQCVMTDIMFPSEPYSIIEIIGEDEEINLINGSLTKLNSIWRDLTL